MKTNHLVKTIIAATLLAILAVPGSAFAGNACFTCITGEAYPDGDYEIDEAI